MSLGNKRTALKKVTQRHTGDTTRGHLLPVSANRELHESSNSKQAWSKETLWLLNEKAPHPDTLSWRKEKSKGLKYGSQKPKIWNSVKYFHEKAEDCMFFQDAELGV